MSTKSGLLVLLCLQGLVVHAASEPTSAGAAPGDVAAGARDSGDAAAAHCAAPHTPGAHICSLVIQSIGVESSGPGTSAELVTTVAGATPRCYHAPAPGTLPNVAGMTRRLLKSWRGQIPILLDSYYPSGGAENCDWLIRDQLPCPAGSTLGDPPCIIKPSQAVAAGPQVPWRKPARELSESCEDPKQGTQFCSGFVESIQSVKDSDSLTVHLEKPDLCLTIDPAADQTVFKIWQAKLELARAAQERHVEAVVLFPTKPKLPAGACPALYQIDIQ
jgi:hypothetical protein